jgi:hypothetical protein
MANNFERMVKLAGEVFAAQNDPTQLDVDEDVMEKLQKIHPATLSDYEDGDGPVVWILLIPTTIDLMQQFVSGNISETELLNKTPLNVPYQALYLCSALVLPEYRHKGLATKVGLEAIQQIRNDHPIEYLFTWSFSKEGANLAHLAANTEGLKLLERPGRIKA